MPTLHLLGVSGSLRRASTNTGLLRAAAALLPEGAHLELASTGALPLYTDEPLDDAAQAAVDAFRGAVSGADGVLIATPEYNYGIPGPLKNALDWASRPSYRSPFAQKPIGLLGASGGAVGSARAQGQLKQVLLGMVAQVFPHPEVLVGQAGSKFDASGELTDPGTREHLRGFLAAYAAWVTKVR
jgi:chromate reductase